MSLTRANPRAKVIVGSTVELVVTLGAPTTGVSFSASCFVAGARTQATLHPRQYLNITQLDFAAGQQTLSTYFTAHPWQPEEPTCVVEYLSGDVSLVGAAATLCLPVAVPTIGGQGVIGAGVVPHISSVNRLFRAEPERSADEEVKAPRLGVTEFRSVDVSSV